LGHNRQAQLSTLVSREAPFTGRAFTTSPYGVAFFGDSRVDHLGIGMVAERTLHSRSRASRPAPAGLLGGVNGQLGSQLVYTATNVRQNGFVVRVVQYISNQVRRQFRFGFFKAASGHGRSTQTHAAGDKWLLGVVRNGVLVDRDVSLAQCFFSHFTGDALGTQVY